MKKETIYAENVERIARDNPLEAYRLELYEHSRIKFCSTLDDELNLVDERRDPFLYLHDQGGAIWAAQRWAKQLSFERCDVLFIYGLGLGYYYLPLKEWLKDHAHYLVFLEDDKEVVYHFLQTELASEILENSQVIVKILPSIEPNEEGWAQLRLSAASLFGAFAFHVSQILALQSYFYSRRKFFEAFSLQWLLGLSQAAERLKEFNRPYSSKIFRNFYANMPYLEKAIPGDQLRNAMESIPAVLCGAGPSLTKQLPLLKTLSDQAFLIASGSAMNAVTQASIIPHAGGGIDHTPTQASRQLTSFAFDVPIFYQNRYDFQAFNQWHGPLLFMTGSGSLKVSNWFEKELGIEDSESIIMGVSTSNFLLEIARFLGCNPIILVGMDLAYTHEKRYAEGVTAHPVEDLKHQEVLGKKEGKLLAVPSVTGGEVHTTNQWILEAVCMGAFKQRHPETLCLNATEGGMAIPGVPNESFLQVIEEYFTSMWDVEGLFHGAMQNAAAHRIPSENVFAALTKWKKSLEVCIEHLAMLSENSEKMLLHQEELYHEPAYEYLLEMLSMVFDVQNSLRIRKLKWQIDPFEEEQAIANKRWRFLKAYAEDHLKNLVDGLKNFEERRASLSRKVPQKRHLPESILQSEFPIGEDRTLFLYPDGKIKVEAFYQSGKLHGSWSFFSLKGGLLYRSWFVEGKRHGKVFGYYDEGSLYKELSYRDGLAEGKQFHYYLDGTIKTVEHYKKGLLNGKVQLYYSNGQLKKEQHFLNGRLHGMERMWSESGKMTLETTW